MRSNAAGADGQMQHRLEALRDRVQLMFLIGGVQRPELREHLDELLELQESMAGMAPDPLDEVAKA